MNKVDSPGKIKIYLHPDIRFLFNSLYFDKSNESSQGTSHLQTHRWSMKASAIAIAGQKLDLKPEKITTGSHHFFKWLEQIASK